MIPSRTVFFPLSWSVKKKLSGGPPKSLMCRKNIGLNVMKNLWKVLSTPKPVLGMQKCSWLHKLAKTNKWGKAHTEESQMKNECVWIERLMGINRGAHLLVRVHQHSDFYYCIPCKINFKVFQGMLREKCYRAVRKLTVSTSTSMKVNMLAIEELHKTVLIRITASFE